MSRKAGQCRVHLCSHALATHLLQTGKLSNVSNQVVVADPATADQIPTRLLVTTEVPSAVQTAQQVVLQVTAECVLVLTVTLVDSLKA